MRRIVHYIVGSCPFCGQVHSKKNIVDESDYDVKFKRCKKCKQIFITGKHLFNDASEKELQEYKSKNNKSYLNVFIVSVCSFIFTVIFDEYEISVLGILVFMLTIYIAGVILFSDIKNRLHTLKFISKNDKELFELEKITSELIQNGCDLPTSTKIAYNTYCSRCGVKSED